MKICKKTPIGETPILENGEKNTPKKRPKKNAHFWKIYKKTPNQETPIFENLEKKHQKETPILKICKKNTNWRNANFGKW